MPQLLFPVETIATAITADKSKMRSLAGGEASSTLLEEIRSAGFDEASAPQLERQLQEYISGSMMGSDPGTMTSMGVISAMPSSQSPSSGNSDENKGTNMSTLDALLRDDDDLEPISRVSSASAPTSTNKRPSSVNSSVVGDDKEVSENVSEEWNAIIKKYIREPSTPLEKERRRTCSPH